MRDKYQATFDPYGFKNLRNSQNSQISLGNLICTPDLQSAGQKNLQSKKRKIDKMEVGSDN